MTIKISREVLLSILMLMTCLHSLRLYLLWQIFQRLKNYLTYRVASSLTLALFFVVSASAFNPQAYLGCVATNGTLPADVAGQVCQLELALALTPTPTPTSTPALTPTLAPIPTPTLTRCASWSFQVRGCRARASWWTCMEWPSLTSSCSTSYRYR